MKKPKFSPKPNSCRQPIRIEHEKTQKPRQPIRIEYHSAETYPILIHCRNIPYLNTWLGDPSRLLARVGCYSQLNTWRVFHPPVRSAHTLTTAVACVQDFVHHLLFTQRSFFSETGTSMIDTAVTAADAVRNSDSFDPSGGIDVEAGPVIADLKSCREKILSQRKAVKDIRKRWFSAETVASSAVGESAPRTVVRISDFVEVGDVQYVAEHGRLCLPCCSRSSPGKGKKTQTSMSPGVSKKTVFCFQPIC